MKLNLDVQLVDVSLKANEWNKLPKNVILQETHGEFKNEFYKSKLSSYKESTLNFAPNMF